MGRELDKGGGAARGCWPKKDEATRSTAEIGGCALALERAASAGKYEGSR